MFNPGTGRMWLAASGGALIAGLAHAGGQDTSLLNGAIRVEPIRLSGVSAQDGRIRMTTPWFDYQPGFGTRSRWAWTWDSFEADTPNPAFGRPWGGTPLCGNPPDLRYFYGLSNNCPYSSNDMLACVPNVACEGVFFAWYWQVDGPGSSEQCFVYVETFENWGNCDSPNPGSGGLGGVLYDFGELAANDDEYYYAAIDLSGTPLRHRMPQDGAGGHQIRYGQAYDPASGELTLPTICQSMLWGTGEWEIPHDDRVGRQSECEYDDDSPPDGQFDLARECYCGFFLRSLCFHVLSPCVGFTARVGTDCACSGDVTADGVIDFGDLTQLLSDFGRATDEIANDCADLDQSGEVDLADLTVLLSRLGADCP